MNLIQNKNALYGLIGIILLVGMSGGIYGLYKVYTIQRNEKAQNAFMSALEEFERRRQEENADMNTVAFLFQEGFEQHQKSSLAPYFLAFKGLCFQAEDDLVQARQVVEQAFTHFSKNDPLYPLYAIKLALMQLEDVQEEVRKEGLMALQRFAEDTKNIHRDMALYWLGEYAAKNGNEAEATKWWNMLLTQESHSPLAQYVDQRNNA